MSAANNNFPSLSSLAVSFHCGIGRCEYKFFTFTELPRNTSGISPNLIVTENYDMNCWSKLFLGENKNM